MLMKSNYENKQQVQSGKTTDLMAAYSIITVKSLHSGSWLVNLRMTDGWMVEK